MIQPTFWTFSLVATCLATVAAADEDFAPPPSTVPHVDLTYATRGNQPLKLDLYVPAGKGPWPTVLWFHGGAWMLGDRTGWPHLMFLVGRGYAVANVDYRLSQAAPFPAQLNDCAAALDFLADHAAAYGLDPARTAVAGESAGGHLAALLGLARGAGLAPADRHPPGPGRVRAVLDLFGPTDLPALAAADPKLTQVIDQLLGGPLADKEDVARAASPVHQVRPGGPPFLILHGTADTVVPPAQSDALAAALTADRVPVRLVSVPGAGHAQPIYWRPERQELMAAFLARSLGTP